MVLRTGRQVKGALQPIPEQLPAGARQCGTVWAKTLRPVRFKLELGVGVVGPTGVSREAVSLSDPGLPTRMRKRPARLAVGFAESPAYYPGTPDPASSVPITLAANTTLSNLNFVVFRPAPGVTVRGVVEKC